MRAERAVLAVAGLALASPATRWLAEQLGRQESLCPLLRITGVPCPSCGGTRAAVHLLAGDPLTALSLNAGATIFMVALAISLLTGFIHAGTLWSLLGPESVGPRQMTPGTPRSGNLVSRT